MSEDRSSSGSLTARWLERLFPVVGEPRDRQDLISLLKQARDRAIFDTEALAMLEGVLQVSDLQVRDIMIPRAQMVVVGRDHELGQVLPVVTDSAHSRFPVIDDDRAEVVGIMLAKDLLQYCGENAPRFKMRDIVRSAVFVPESKRLNVLLREFRASRNHMAIVIDEYGNAAGLVTIEDVLEQIVGEIEDEYDFDEGAFILKRGPNNYTIKAHTTVEEFNEYFGVSFDDSDFDTIGGLMVSALGHLPGRGESVVVDGFRFTVVRADSRKVRLLQVEQVADPAASPTEPAAPPSPPA
ncbi:MAG: CBS domain-containing protein [Gammaproteobacteria bacterium]|nr:CBS domain-containing protein [Gammaproteobacteria bacterium]MCP5317887.1 CBS domain-containing protein [Chromatiaceae bacterium]MCP5429101.1 CBS domain-containing protein [Chromatiaceae bacterium]MCP5434641.1 CBS domain-containing protein [Chromatiaceae bacterium]HOP18219.1 transporter associated domain-containing protein [Gammaproteobacteria bacterium]